MFIGKDSSTKRVSSSKQFDKGPDEVSQKQEQSPQEALAAKTAIFIKKIVSKFYFR